MSHTETSDSFFDEIWEPFLDAFSFLDDVAEDAPSNFRELLRSGLVKAGKLILPDILEEGRHRLVDGSVNDCSLRCAANFGCCNIVTASSLLDAIEDLSVGGPVGVPLGIMHGIAAGYDGAKCAKDASSCLNNCPQPPPATNCELASADSEAFVPPCVERAIDPNEKISPDGYGEQRFVSIQREVSYTINFENVPTATAYAQRVHITDQLDPNLDPRTLRLREIGFKQYRFQVPENRAFFQQRVPLGPDLGNLLGDISAGVDLATGTVS